jgi:hypothetical protein
VKTLRQRIILGIVGVAVLAVLVVFGKKKAHRAGQPAEVAPVSSRVFAVDEWLDSCLTGCRRTAPRRLPNLSAEKRERYCTVNCECGMEKMTEPGPGPRQVRAPSRYWLSLGEDDQLKAANDCQKRTTAQVGQ